MKVEFDSHLRQWMFLLERCVLQYCKVKLWLYVQFPITKQLFDLENTNVSIALFFHYIGINFFKS